MMDFKDISNLNIKSIDSRPKENVGSLLKLFSSEYFTLDMAMIYLYKKKAETGVHDFLVNKLYEYNDHDVGFYIPQLCYMLIKTHSQTLERFLLDKCVKSVTLFLKILWCLKAYGQAEKKNKKGGYEYVESVITKCEMAMVNGTTVSKILVDPFGMPVKRQTDLTPEEIEAMVTEAERKRNRVEYLSETLRLINILVNISLKLKAQKIEDRKAILKSYVKRINKWLHHMRKKHSKDKDEYFRKLFYGIQLPFSSNSEDCSTQVVRILEDEITCFNTKKRAPYRIVVETIDMNELDSVMNRTKSETKHENHDLNHSILNNSLSHDEDNWEDLISEQAKEESSPGPSISNNSNFKENNYKALVAFGKIAKEEEAKWKDASLLKGVDLVQKFEVMKNKTGTNTLQTPEKEEDLSTKRKPTLDFSEETKDVEILHQIHKSNLRSFNKLFPRKPLLRRQSFHLDEEKRRRKRRLSLHELKGSELIHCMEKFKEKHLPRRMLPMYTQIIDELKQETFELPSSKGLYPLATMPVKEENNQSGWGPWEELWESKQQAIRDTSAFGQFKSYKLRCLVIKANDDLRQELLVMQILKKIRQIWKDAGLTLALKTYDILVTSNDSGILEFVIDTLSLDGIKKKNPGKSLHQFFTETFGYDFEEAQKNFMDSLAAYSLVCYFLQIKDRHNGNILLDAHGFLVHIDFGFILTMSPGGINFESAPFKLTQEYVELMGGLGSATFIYFKMQLIKGFMELRKYVDSIVYMLQIMMEGSDLPCFETFDITTFRERFKERSTDNEAIEYVTKLIESSFDNWRTVQYDNFQKYTNGILP